MNEDDSYVLALPFVACVSEGGTFDDDAFVAGFSAGQHYSELRNAPNATGWSAHVEPGMVRQYDLIAMHFGYVMTVHDDEDSGWVHVTMRRGEGE